MLLLHPVGALVGLLVGAIGAGVDSIGPIAAVGGRVVGEIVGEVVGEVVGGDGFLVGLGDGGDTKGANTGALVRLAPH